MHNLSASILAIFKVYDDHAIPAMLSILCRQAQKGN